MFAKRFQNKLTISSQKHNLFKHAHFYKICMKQNYYFVGISIIIIIILIAGCTQQIPKEPDDKTNFSEVINKTNLENNCETDDNCKLINKNLKCSICASCSIDYSTEDYIPVNSNIFEEYYNNWLKENCPDFYTCKKSKFSPFEECEKYLRCPACEPMIKNQNFKAKCINKICTKINE